MTARRSSLYGIHIIRDICRASLALGGKGKVGGLPNAVTSLSLSFVFFFWPSRQRWRRIKEREEGKGKGGEEGSKTGRKEPLVLVVCHRLLPFFDFLYGLWCGVLLDTNSRSL